eukprot:7194751-Prymnesium_polylepis.1
MSAENGEAARRRVRARACGARARRWLTCCLRRERLYTPLVMRGGRGAHHTQPPSGARGSAKAA